MALILSPTEAGKSADKQRMLLTGASNLRPGWSPKKNQEDVNE